MSRPDDSAAAAHAHPLIVPIFIPQLGCPHQCVFCSQPAITDTPRRCPTPDQIRQEVSRFLEYGKRPSSTVQISFFGGNFLGLKSSSILKLLEAAAEFVQNETVDSIRFSTRPDTVCEKRLELLTGFPVSTIELGVQSMHDRVLELAERGHRAADTIAAAERVKQRGYRLGLQMMVGLPGDSEDGAMETARRMAALAPDFVRIYPTLVLEGSPLADWFRSGRYRPMPLDACVTLVKRICLFFKARHIPVIRMGLQASDGLNAETGLVAGPYHPAFGHQVYAEIVLDAISAAIAKMAAPIPDPLIIQAHPRMISRVQGLKKKNIFYLKQKFLLEKVLLVQDATLAKDHVRVADQLTVLP
ncbi:radical SAM protein [Desulfosarcina widdelii]|uniref:Radical SAM protein n=1 Tax=Desulfosarcina widdelii TaxID=947919 RepID=A0A5K7ZKH8_9BACT|nr:radical SAM protein [Desulfosarcina widdelii]BBO76537.1 radical SAM protein [Desulfosarcina widdelii]